MIKNSISIGIVVVVVTAFVFYWSGIGRAPTILAIDASDTVVSWTLPSSFKDGGAIEAKARAEIERLKALLGGGSEEPTDYTLYVGIAKQYELLGEGKDAYEYLNKALAIDSEKTGLAWHNMGVLMAKLGAYNTAATSYRRAVEAQPHISLFHTARLDFLMERFASDRARIESAFAEAFAALEESPSILQLKARYDAGN